jgi:SAM-dependent methyltransferase
MKEIMSYTFDENRPWLGGATIGGDPSTYYPQMWNWIVSDLKVKSVIDVGCGEGVALRYFKELGCEVLGIDGLSIGPDIIQHDYTLGPYRPHKRYDLCYCVEFVEHVEEQFMRNFLRTFRCAKMIFLTHAFPGQQGVHHVNCQIIDYWKGALAAIGYHYDYTLTQIARAYAGFNTDQYNHFVRSGAVFLNKTTINKRK